MGSPVGGDNGTPLLLRSPRSPSVTVALLAAILMLLAACGSGAIQADEPTVAETAPREIESTTTTSSTTTSSSTTTLLPDESPALEPRYVVPLTEAAPEAKQLAVDIAYWLTTYEASDDLLARVEALAGASGAPALAEASEPLTYPGSWSRGAVIYPQLGGLRNDKASVMVVTRQTVGSGAEVEFSLVRTLDVRLVEGESGWELDRLASAGGTFDDLDDLTAAHEIARDPRIVMPDSARLDILSGQVSPTLLRVMAELADQTTYEVAVLTTGHPIHVFETDRQSAHTAGKAVDIIRIGDRLVIDDRSEDSATRAVADWLYDHPDVRQVGSPWDLDGKESRRSFTDLVHQDHIHLAVEDRG